MTKKQVFVFINCYDIDNFVDVLSSGNPTILQMCFLMLWDWQKHISSNMKEARAMISLLKILSNPTAALRDVNCTRQSRRAPHK